MSMFLNLSLDPMRFQAAIKLENSMDLAKSLSRNTGIRK